MKIQVLQYDVQWMDAAANIETIDRLLLANECTADLVVLPEMYLSGFNMDAASAAIYEDSREISALQKVAAKYGTCLVGSLAIGEGEHYYNRVLMISGDGIVGRYDKRFRFSPSSESEVFAQKYTAELIDFQGWKILPQVCYDLRFPEGVREVDSPDLILYMANWPTPRIVHWDTLLSARAIENQCYVIGCNRTGIDANNWEFPGHSKAVMFDGTVTTIDTNSDVLTVDIDRTELEVYRAKYPFLLDKAL